VESVRSICINLDHIGNPGKAPDGDGFIQHEARRRVLDALVSFDLPVADPEENANRPPQLDIIKDRRHDAILVSARRGEGKTTFLTNVLETIQSGDYRELLARLIHAEARTGLTTVA
jgi:hypothetical protein